MEAPHGQGHHTEAKTSLASYLQVLDAHCSPGSLFQMSCCTVHGFDGRPGPSPGSTAILVTVDLFVTVHSQIDTEGSSWAFLKGQPTSPLPDLHGGCPWLPASFPQGAALLLLLPGNA